MIEERVTPGISPDGVMQEHIDRYEFAKKYVSEKSVLDVACGSGYGSFMLSKTAKSVTGVDISIDAIEYAKTNYPASNIQYYSDDATHLLFYDGSFDVVISFETIEHIPDYKTFLKECRRVLKPGGVFICSTPNALVSSPDGNIENPYHVVEFSYDEFNNILQDHFSTIEVHGQHNIDSLKEFLFNSYFWVKKKLGIRGALFCRDDPVVSFPVCEFKKGIVNSAYIIVVCGGRV